MKNFKVNREEMITGLEMGLALVLPIWAGMFIVAKVWG